MRKLFLIAHLIFCLMYKKSDAQTNLVQNPSFEDTTSCDMIGGTPSVVGWSSASSSPDYFNSVSHSYCYYTLNVPSSVWGYQYAYDGNSYMGFNTYYPSLSNWREWIQAPLLDTLIANKKYCGSFYVNLASNCQRATDDIGAYFSDTAVQCCGGAFNELSSQINNPQGNFITDTTNWTLISGIFTALGGEKFITIGNFKNDAHTSVVMSNPGSPNQETYYLVDMVSLYELPDINAGYSDTICPGGTSNLNASCVGCSNFQYHWFPSTGLDDSTILNPTATPTQTTTYYFGLIDTTGIIPCISSYIDSVTIMVSCVGIDEVNKDLNFTLFPNPTSDEISISTGNTSLKDALVEVTDISGKQIFQQRINLINGTGKINIDAESGLYFVKLRSSENEKCLVRKIVIAK